MNEKLLNMAKEAGLYLETPNGEEHYVIPMLKRFSELVLAAADNTELLNAAPKPPIADGEEKRCFIVSTKTSSIAFATKELAHKYMGRFSASVSGGMTVSEIHIIDTLN